MRDAALPIDDRGFAYGDGLFETVLVSDGEPRLWDYHMARLAEGIERLSLPSPDFEALQTLPAQCGAGLQVLKLVVTRGSGGRGYRPPNPAELRWRWTSSPFQPSPSRWFDGITVRCCELRLGSQPRLAGIKHLARLENVLARQEWHDDAIAEGLLCDGHGDLVEATTMNVIWRRNGRFETPLLDRCGVRGTLLSALNDTLELHWVREGIDALLDADAVWLINSVQGVWPLRRLEDAAGQSLQRWQPGSDCLLQRTAHRWLGYPLTREN